MSVAAVFMPNAETFELGTRALTIERLDTVARGAADVSFPDEARERVERSHAFVREIARSGRPIYGLNTGCGPLASCDVDDGVREQFQRNLVRSHAVSLGALLPTTFVRAAMLVRAQVLAQGYSGVDPATIDVLATMLNEGIHPLVREVGSVGASGDLVELAQIALALLGEGEVGHRGNTVAAADALRAVGREPLVPSYREGLALINGTSCHAGAAAVLHARARRVAAAAEIAAVMIVEALRGKAEAFDEAFHRLRPHAGHAAVAARVVAMLRGSSLVSSESPADCQDAYTLRCIPQVHGAVDDALARAGEVIETELGAVIDNPVFLVEENRVVHGGNFHGQPVAMAIDQMKCAVVELGVMSERRVARLLDASLNDGLPPFLVADSPGPSNGFMGLQYCTSSMAADNAVLAAPASVRSVPTNANNQDVVSMGMVAARQAARVIDNVERMVAIELLCAAQALDLRGVARAGVGARAAHGAIREVVAPLDEDRPMTADVDAVCRLIDDGSLGAAVAAAVG